MDNHCVIKLNSPFPLVHTAIHNGHRFSEKLVKLSALNGSERLREEDPYTGVWAGISKNYVIGQRSRFEYDLNRSPDRAIYLEPSDAWGMTVWKKQPSESIINNMLANYYNIYERLHSGFSRLIEKHGKIVILDIHSYNHRRNGAGAPPDDPRLNPELNIGTGTMDRAYWGSVVDSFMEDLKHYNFLGRQLDIRENVKFRGGYFPHWIHENFPESACCISVEVKKFYMDEWTGKPNWDVIIALSDMFSSAIPGLISTISKKKR